MVKGVYEMKIETERLILRMFENTDYDDLFEYLVQRENDEFEGYPGITYENGKVFQHFGHTEKIKIYQINNGKIVSENIVDTSVCGHEKLH